MNLPDIQGMADAWHRASDADVACGIAELADYDPAVVAIIQAEADRRGIDLTTRIDGVSAPRSVYLPILWTILRFFMRHRLITAILVGVAYQRANKAIAPVLQPYVRTPATSIAIGVASMVVFALAIGVLCLPLRAYRTVLSTSAFACLGAVGAAIPYIARWTHTWRAHKSYLAFLLVLGVFIVWAVPCLLLSAVVFLRNRYRPVYPSGHCTKCGYKLYGLPEPRCPECGKPFEPQDVKA